MSACADLALGGGAARGWLLAEEVAHQILLWCSQGTIGFHRRVRLRDSDGTLDRAREPLPAILLKQTPPTREPSRQLPGPAITAGIHERPAARGSRGCMCDVGGRRPRWRASRNMNCRQAPRHPIVTVSGAP